MGKIMKDLLKKLFEIPVIRQLCHKNRVSLFALKTSDKWVNIWDGKQCDTLMKELDKLDLLDVKKIVDLAIDKICSTNNHDLKQFINAEFDKKWDGNYCKR